MLCNVEIQMNIKCPYCSSSRIAIKGVAKRAGAAVGTVGGATTGAVSTLAGARIGGAIGVVGGPVGLALGSLVGAVLGGLVGAASGRVAGAKIGEILDERLLDNFYCEDCGRSFGNHSN